MDKSTKELTLRRNEAQESIKAITLGIGYALLTNEKKAYLSFLGPDKAQLSIDKYNSYVADRNRLSEDIVAIKDLLSNIADVKERQIEAKKQITILKSSWNDLYQKLGNALYDNYSTDYVSFFGSYYNDISSEKKKQQEAERQAELLNDERSTQPFFKKIVSNVKYTTQIGIQKAAESRINSLYVKAGMACWTGKLLPDSSSLSEFVGSLKTVLAECEDLDKRIAAAEGAVSAIERNLESLADDLKGLEVSGNSKIRINNLEKMIKEKQVKQDEQCLFLGNDFYSLVSKVSSERQISLSEGFSKEMLKNVQNIYLLNEEIASIDRRIEIIQISKEMDDFAKQIIAYKDTIEYNKRRIVKLNNENTDLSVRIDVSEKDLKSLSQKKAALEILDSKNARLLEEPERQADSASKQSTETVTKKPNSTTKTKATPKKKTTPKKN